MNLIPILEKLPKDYKLWSPLCGYCHSIKIEENETYPIVMFSEKGYYLRFTNEGKFYDENESECLLFPSKEERDWNKFISNIPPFKIERVKGEKYYYIQSNFVQEDVEYFTLNDDMNYKYNNYFNTRRQAEIALENVQQCLKSLSNH